MALQRLSQWKITIDSQPMEVMARALPPPIINYKKCVSQPDFRMREAS